MRQAVGLVGQGGVQAQRHEGERRAMVALRQHMLTASQDDERENMERSMNVIMMSAIPALAELPPNRRDLWRSVCVTPWYFGMMRRICYSLARSSGIGSVRYSECARAYDTGGTSKGRVSTAKASSRRWGSRCSYGSFGCNGTSLTRTWKSQ